MSVDHIDPEINVDVASTEYLYGVNPLYFANKTYKEILKTKIKLTKHQTNLLYKKQEKCNDYECKSKIEQWLNDVYKAREHNEKLLKEYLYYENKLYK